MSNVLFEQWFRLADEDRDGMIGGMEAVKFFQRSGLPQNLLGEVDALLSAPPVCVVDTFCADMGVRLQRSPQLKPSTVL